MKMSVVNVLPRPLWKKHFRWHTPSYLNNMGNSMSLCFFRRSRSHTGDFFKAKERLRGGGVKNIYFIKFSITFHHLVMSKVWNNTMNGNCHQKRPFSIPWPKRNWVIRIMLWWNVCGILYIYNVWEICVISISLWTLSIFVSPENVLFFSSFIFSIFLSVRLFLIYISRWCFPSIPDVITPAIWSWPDMVSWSSFI